MLFFHCEMMLSHKYFQHGYGIIDDVNYFQIAYKLQVKLGWMEKMFLNDICKRKNTGSHGDYYLLNEYMSVKL